MTHRGLVARWYMEYCFDNTIETHNGERPNKWYPTNSYFDGVWEDAVTHCMKIKRYPDTHVRYRVSHVAVIDTDIFSPFEDN